jgi:hypothetical protein
MGLILKQMLCFRRKYTFNDTSDAEILLGPQICQKGNKYKIMLITYIVCTTSLDRAAKVQKLF